MSPTTLQAAPVAVTEIEPPPCRRSAPLLQVEFTWMLPLAVTLPLPETRIASQPSGSRASIANGAATLSWFVATALAATSHATMFASPAKIEGRVFPIRTSM
jgi:hypothetical protein